MRHFPDSLELKVLIELECKRRLKKFDRNTRRLLDERTREAMRSNLPYGIFQPRIPVLWELNPELDPRAVRKRAGSLGYGVSKSLKSSSYRPLRPSSHLVEKPLGGSRQVTSFGIADEIVSRQTYKSLMRKNLPILSSRSYAYRRDMNSLDALRSIQSNFGRHSRVFVAEFDFRSYFDSVEHDYLAKLFVDLGIYMASYERRVVDTFVKSELPFRNIVEKGAPAQVRSKGVPQGTSISLFLANLALVPLDRELEELGVGHARFSDDTLIWAKSYDQICRASDALMNWAEQSGVYVNQEKSPGISSVSKESFPGGEIRSVSSVTFLGHQFGIGRTEPSRDRLERIKNQLNSVIYRCLLKEPLNGSQNLARIGVNDRDYMVCISQLRRLIYGSLSERAVDHALNSEANYRIRLGGVIAHYGVVSNKVVFEELDDWLSMQLWMALRKRTRLLKPVLGAANVPMPWGIGVRDLKRLCTTSVSTGMKLDISVPSSVKMAVLVERQVRDHGTSVIVQKGALY